MESNSGERCINARIRFAEENEMILLLFAVKLQATKVIKSYLDSVDWLISIGKK